MLPEGVPEQRAALAPAGMTAAGGMPEAEKLAQLCAFGFTEERARLALRVMEGSVEHAVEMLLSMGDDAVQQIEER